MGTGGQQGQIQIFGQTKIIADERSNSLLIYATRQDMDTIKDVVSKLDVLLAQVLIEAVIIDYQLGPNTFNFGVSAAQNPKSFSGGSATNLQNIIGAGGVNNGPSFYNFLNGSLGSNAPTSVFGNGLSPGFSYFGNIGPTWNVAVQAAETDSHASIIQRPRIQTSQAKAAQFFVGETVPYVNSTYYGGSVGGNSSSYSQLSVGVELDVTPFINPDGLVVMDINQEIDDLGDYVTLSDGSRAYSTTKRTLSSEIAVKNGDTVMLGGFIKNQKSTSRSGVPLLQDIPLLGYLFSQHSDSKQREELIVMMRPTVLRTPELAAAQAVKEKERLPGVSAALAEEVRTEHKLVEAGKKAELKSAEAERIHAEPWRWKRVDSVDTNTVAIPNP
jgi:general secretion pathway protein D